MERLFTKFRAPGCWAFHFMRRFSSTGYVKMDDLKFTRPVDRIHPVSAGYGARGSAWNWHVDPKDGLWKAGQVDGIGQHKGYDFACPVGTDVVAPVDLEVESAGLEDALDLTRGFGMRLRGTFLTPHGVWRIYLGHLSRIRRLVGDFVREGEIIGKSGNSGNSTGPHLHVEVRDDSGQQHPMLFKEA